jgi:hypothetical protein
MREKGEVREEAEGLYRGGLLRAGARVRARAMIDGQGRSRAHPGHLAGARG